MGFNDQEIAAKTAANSTKNKVDVDARQIINGVAEFSKVTPLLKERLPKYSDEAATIYLQLSSYPASSEMQGLVGILKVPCPLVTNQRVCVFLKDESADVKEKRAMHGINEPSFLTRVKESSAECKVVSESEVKSAIMNNDTSGLEEIVKTYDLLLVSPTLAGQVAQAVLPTLNAVSKRLTRTDCNYVNFTAMFLKPSLDCYTIRVGHTGFSENELIDNIQAVMRRIQYWGWFFPQGLAHFKTITLKTGTTPGITIYTTVGEVAPLPSGGAYQYERWHDSKKKPRSKEQQKKQKEKQKLKQKQAKAEALNRKTEDGNSAPVGGQEVKVEPTAKSPAAKRRKQKKKKLANGDAQLETVDGAGVPQATALAAKRKMEDAADGDASLVKVEAVDAATSSPAIKKQKVIGGVSPLVDYDEPVVVTTTPVANSKKNRKKRNNKNKKLRAANGVASSLNDVTPVGVKIEMEQKSQSSLGETAVQLSTVGLVMKKKKKRQQRKKATAAT